MRARRRFCQAVLAGADFGIRAGAASKAASPRLMRRFCARLRSAWGDACARQRRRLQRQRPGDGGLSSSSRPAGPSWAAPTPRRILRPPSIAPTSPMVNNSVSNGARRAGRTQPLAPTRSGRRCWPDVDHHHSIPQKTKRLREFINKRKAWMRYELYNWTASAHARPKERRREARVSKDGPAHKRRAAFGIILETTRLAQALRMRPKPTARSEDT